MREIESIKKLEEGLERFRRFFEKEDKEKTGDFKIKLEKLVNDYAEHKELLEKEKNQLFKRRIETLRSDLENTIANGKWTKNFFNIIEVLGLTKWEESYSNILAWLLNPYEGHGLGDQFLRRFIEELNLKKSFRFEFVQTHRELSGPTSIPDIVVDWKSQGESFSLIIENKIFSQEGDKQTQRQYRDFSKRAKEVYFVFLTPGGYSPLNENFKPVSYSQVIKILKGLEPKGHAKIFLEHFVECLKRNITREGNENEEI